jgi:hypothetical protein
MAVYNAITGLKRRMPRYLTSRKKRKTTSSTVAQRMFAEDAMNAYFSYMMGYKKALMFLLLLALMDCDLCSEQGEYIKKFFLLSASLFASKAVRMLRLDSELLDLRDVDLEDVGYNKPLVDITLASYTNDDECENNTRFSKGEIMSIMQYLDFGDGNGYIRVYYNGTVYYKFRAVTLFLYMLRKLSTGRTHKDLADNEFGGDSSRWGRGYKWMVKYVDKKSEPLIGPQALAAWAPHFPFFAETLRTYIMRDKERNDRDGNNLPPLVYDGAYIAKGDFIIFGITDCTFYELCRPGSGPDNQEPGAPRKEGWYIKQRAFYSGYQRGMEACMKLLTICLPNGMTGAVYGPTSGRQDDRTLFWMANFDRFIMELCIHFHGADKLFSVYGDGIFAGYWFCLRTKHEGTEMMPLTPAQDSENDNMKSVRECVEWSYARAEQLWPLMNKKQAHILELDSAMVFGQFRVCYFLTNCKVASEEGSTMTGTRMFACPPPSLSDYLAMA